MKELQVQFVKLIAEAMEIDVMKTESSLLKKRFEKLDVDNLQKDLIDAMKSLRWLVWSLMGSREISGMCGFNYGIRR